MTRKMTFNKTTPHLTLKTVLTYIVLCAAPFIMSACTGNLAAELERLGRYGNSPSQTRADTTPAPVNPAPTARRAQGANSAPTKVAVLLPLTGAHGALGQDMLNAAQLALFNIAHDDFSLVPYDTMGTPSGARAAAQQVLRDDAQLILGPVFADSVRAVKSVTALSSVNMIAFSTDWSLAGGNTYLMGFLPFDQVDRVVSYAAQQGIKRIGALTPDTDYGRIVSTVLRKVAAQRGVSVTAEAILPTNGANLDAPIRQFATDDYAASSGARPATLPFDAVFMPIGGQAAITTSNLLTRYGAPPNTIRRLGTGVMDDARLYDEPTLQGAWIGVPQPSLRTGFEKEYVGVYGRAPARLATLSYDATALAAVLAQRDRARDAVPNFTRADITNPNGFSGVDGAFRFLNNGVAERGLAVMELKSGRLVTASPAPRSFAR